MAQIIIIIKLLKNNKHVNVARILLKWQLLILPLNHLANPFISFAYIIKETILFTNHILNTMVFQYHILIRFIRKRELM